MASALADDGTVYAGSGGPRLYAIEPDGVVRWETWATADGVPVAPRLISEADLRRIKPPRSIAVNRTAEFLAAVTITFDMTTASCGQPAMRSRSRCCGRPLSALAD